MAAGTDFAVNHNQIAQTGDSMFTGYLEPEVAQDYFAEAEKTSIVQRVAQKIPMGATGVKIPHWNGDVSAQWIGEGDMKPITKGDLTSESVEPHKIATIFIASAETVRANPANYIGTMRTKIGTAIAMAFDSAALYGTDSPFDKAIADTTKEQYLSSATAYDALAVDGLGQLVSPAPGSAKHRWQATLFDDTVEPILNGAKDQNGRPLFIESTYEGVTPPYREGRIIGRQTILSDHVVSDDGTVIGFMGDFNQVLWGQVGGLSFDVSDQATLNLGTPAAPQFVSLWQHNLVAVRCEAEFGLLINDVHAFVKLTTVDPTP
jgi:HK97 family phage major capsid protein